MTHVSNVSNVERELKVVPDDSAMLDRLATIERLGEFEVRGRRHEVQRNSFFDSASRSLSAAQVGFRRRTVQGRRLATWGLKAEGAQVRGVVSRTEVELQLDPDTPPALAVGTLRDAARSRGALPLAEDVSEALASGGLPRPEPFLETETDRTILDLEAAEQGWAIELALDRVHLLGHAYTELEIEAELKHGDEAALASIRAALESMGRVRDSEGSKLKRAMAHLSACDCEIPMPEP